MAVPKMNAEPCTYAPGNVMAVSNMTSEPNVKCDGSTLACQNRVDVGVSDESNVERSRFGISSAFLDVPGATMLMKEHYKTIFVVLKIFTDMCLQITEEFYDQFFELFKTIFNVEKVYPVMCLHFVELEPFKNMCLLQYLSYPMYELYNMFFFLFETMCPATLLMCFMIKTMCLACSLLFYVFKTNYDALSSSGDDGSVGMSRCFFSMFSGVCTLQEAAKVVTTVTLTGVGSTLSSFGWMVIPCLLAVRTEGRELLARTVISMMFLVMLHLSLSRRMMSHLSRGYSVHQSRIEKRRKCRTVGKLKKQHMTIILLNGISTSQCMVANQMMEQMGILAQAATRAATAAERALTASNLRRAQDGLQAASRALKPPDTFDGTEVMNFIPWKQQFTSWLSFGDTRFSDRLERIEKMESAASIGSYNDEDTELAREVIYAVLGSYLRGHCSQTNARMAFFYGTS